MEDGIERDGSLRLSFLAMTVVRRGQVLRAKSDTAISLSGMRILQGLVTQSGCIRCLSNDRYAR
jgi:hypothetical protein